MKKVFFFCVVGFAIIMVVIFTGCPSVLDPDENGDASSPQVQARVVASTTDLPPAGEDNLGYLYFIEDQSIFVYSNGMQYVPIDLTGPEGPAGPAGSTGAFDWLGSLDDFPPSPVKNQGMFHETHGKAYFYDGTDWQLFARSGIDGTNGATWFTGTTAPSDELGTTGDLYLDSKTWQIYRKSDNTWGFPIGTIRGENGNDGAPGAQGIPGAAGNDGATWLTGIGAPADGIGAAGDLYLNISNGDVHVYSPDIGWSATTLNVIGPQGEPGVDGATWLTDSGEPSDHIGNDGDFYLDSTSWEVYRKVENSWGVPIGTIRGADGKDGVDGDQGVPGAPGVNGATWLTGSGEPSDELGSNGDLYLDTESVNIYSKMEDTWSYHTNLFGRNRYTVTLRVVANENQPNVTAIAGAKVSVDGVVVGLTDGNGMFTYSSSAEGIVEVGVTKKFFTPVVDGESVSFPGAAGTTISLEMAPQVFVPDTHNGRVVRVDDMNDETGSITTFGDTDSMWIYAPTWVVPDYERGRLYVADGNFAAEMESPPMVVRMNAFPPQLTDVEPMVSSFYLPFFLEGGDFQAASVSPWANMAMTLLSQISLLPDGDGVIGVDPNSTYDRTWGSKVVTIHDRSVRLDGYFFARDSYDPGRAFQGIAVLPDGRYIYTETIHDPDTGSPGALVGIVSDISDSEFDTPQPFVPESLDLWGDGLGQLKYPTTIHVSHDRQYVYISDTGRSGDNPEIANHRIVRYNLDGSNPVSFGTFGTEEGQFTNPVILGVLPDNRIYILDNGDQVEGTDCLIRIDNIFGDGWIEVDGSAIGGFDFARHEYIDTELPVW